MHEMFSRVGLRHMNFLKYSGNIVRNERNRPLFAIRAQSGLFGTSMSRNFWISYEILRKFHIPAQDSFDNILCKLPYQFYLGMNAMPVYSA